MRITIEIDGAQVETATGSVPPGAGQPAAPPEVLAAAAAIGAEDAGPAPSAEPAAGMPMAPPSAEGAAVVEGAGDLGAGPAPGGTVEPEPVSVEAEDAGAGEDGA